MVGTSKLSYNGKLISLSELTNNEYKQFIISTKYSITKSLGKRVIRVIEK